MHLTAHTLLLRYGPYADNIHVKAVLQPLLSCGTFPGQDLQAVKICLGEPHYLFWLDQLGSTGHEHGEITLKLIE